MVAWGLGEGRKGPSLKGGVTQRAPPCGWIILTVGVGAGVGLGIHCCCYSVAKSCLTLCEPMDCSMPGFPVLHHLPELAQTHVHSVSDAIQPSHPLALSSSAFTLSQHQTLFPVSQLFASGGQSIGASASATVLPMNIQG